MRLNEFTILCSPPVSPDILLLKSAASAPVPEFVLLVPYEFYHVPAYHEWMAGDTQLSRELRQLTATEPLSLDEEYAFQKSWREDENKLTFILLHGPTWLQCRQNQSTLDTQQCEIAAMMGDVNIFLQSATFSENEDEETSDTKATEERKVIGELELMIAEPRFRRCGFGGRVVQCMQRYARDVLGLETLVVKIGDANAASQKLFLREGFSVTKHSEVFHETEMSLSLTNCLHSHVDSPPVYNALDSRILR